MPIVNDKNLYLMDIEDLKTENEKLKMRCKRLVLILNECLSYVDNIDEYNKLSVKIEEIKKNYN